MGHDDGDSGTNCKVCDRGPAECHCWRCSVCDKTKCKCSCPRCKNYYCICPKKNDPEQATSQLKKSHQKPNELAELVKTESRPNEKFQTHENYCWPVRIVANNLCVTRKEFPRLQCKVCLTDDCRCSEQINSAPSADTKMSHTQVGIVFQGSGRDPRLTMNRIHRPVNIYLKRIGQQWQKRPNFVRNALILTRL